METSTSFLLKARNWKQTANTPLFLIRIDPTLFPPLSYLQALTKHSEFQSPHFFLQIQNPSPDLLSSSPSLHSPHTSPSSPLLLPTAPPCPFSSTTKWIFSDNNVSFQNSKSKTPSIKYTAYDFFVSQQQMDWFTLLGKLNRFATFITAK